MTDDLVKRPVLRIYTEATSGNGGLWAFSPYKSVHTVFVEESNYRDLEDRIEALTARAEAAEAELKAMTAERDRAIDDAKYNAQYVDLVVHYRNERDAMAAENERLREALIEERTETLWSAYNTGAEQDGRWRHMCMSDGEWLARECGLDASQADYPADVVKGEIPLAAERFVAALKGQQQ